MTLLLSGSSLTFEKAQTAFNIHSSLFTIFKASSEFLKQNAWSKAKHSDSHVIATGSNSPPISLLETFKINCLIRYNAILQ
jgi:hypothetical protein